MSEIILEASEVWCSRAFRTDDPSHVRGVSLEIERGAQVHLFGPPQGGKNLLLHVLGLLEKPDRGRMRLLGSDTDAWSVEQLSAFRSTHVGFLFSSPYLLPDFSVVENVAMPFFKLMSVAPDEAKGRTLEVLELTGMAAFQDEPVQNLSVEQQQRVALARAVITRPDFLMAEEPLAGLDAGLAEVFLADLRRVAMGSGTTLIWSGGETPVAGARGICVRDGQVSERMAGVQKQE